MRKTLDWLSDAFINRHLGQWAFMINRLTGVIIALYLIPHIYINSLALLFGKDAYTKVLHAFEQQPLLRIAEVLLITAVAFHTFNGARILLIRYFDLSRKQTVLLVFVFLLTIVVFAAALMMYWPDIVGSHSPSDLAKNL